MTQTTTRRVRPVTVTASEWNVSYETSTAFEGAKLNVHKLEGRPNRWGGWGVSVRHPEWNGLMFATTDDAADFALEVGLTKVWNPR